MSPLQHRWVKSLVPIVAIAVVAAVHAVERQRGTVPACAGSASCSGDINQPLLELLLPAVVPHP